MFHQTFPRPALPLPKWPAPSAGNHRQVLRDCSEAAQRDAWMAAFTCRLGELRPREDVDLLMTIAADLWEDVGGHDPMICAEMEHEARFGGE